MKKGKFLFGFDNGLIRFNVVPDETSIPIFIHSVRAILMNECITFIRFKYTDVTFDFRRVFETAYDWKCYYTLK